MRVRMVCVVGALAISLLGRASAASEPQTATFPWEDHSITVVIAGCQVIDTVLKNTSDHPLGSVSTALILISPTGETISSDGMNFPPTEAHGTARPAHTDFTDLGNCQGDHLEMRR